MNKEQDAVGLDKCILKNLLQLTRAVLLQSRLLLLFCVDVRYTYRQDNPRLLWTVLFWGRPLIPVSFSSVYHCHKTDDRMLLVRRKLPRELSQTLPLLLYILILWYIAQYISLFYSYLVNISQTLFLSLWNITLCDTFRFLSYELLEYHLVVHFFISSYSYLLNIALYLIFNSYLVKH